MKLLSICSSLDLSMIGGGIPVYWQLLRGFHQAGTEVIAATCFGTSFSSPWWRSHPRPFVQNNAFDFALSRGTDLNKRIAAFLYYRSWKKQLRKLFSVEKNIDAVFLTSAIHIAKEIPSWIRKNFGIPTVYYETDIQNLPKYSLDHQPEKHRFPNYSECDAVACSFEKISQEIREHGVQNVWTVPFGADPMIFTPMPAIEQKTDVFFSGFGVGDREEWMQKMIAEPSVALKDSKFLVEGHFHNFDFGNAKRVPSVSLDRHTQHCCGSKINLNILREQFISAGVINSRIFELASLGCCMVSNPSGGIKEFFEPEKEIIVINNEKDAIDKYKWLLSSEEDRTQIGNSARQRILKEHTYLNRAQQIINIIKKIKM